MPEPSIVLHQLHALKRAAVFLHKKSGKKKALRRFQTQGVVCRGWQY
jgi:hypothetical protein